MYIYIYVYTYIYIDIYVYIYNYCNPPNFLTPPAGSSLLFPLVMPAGSQKSSGKGPPVPAMASWAGVRARKGESV